MLVYFLEYFDAKISHKISTSYGFNKVRVSSFDCFACVKQQHDKTDQISNMADLKFLYYLGPSCTIPDSYRSDINFRGFPVLSALKTFHIWRFCLILLYYHNFKCQSHLETVKFGVAPMRIRYRVTGALMYAIWITFHGKIKLAIYKGLGIY